MHVKGFLMLLLVGCSAAPGASAQGTKELSNPGPIVVYPTPPRVDPARPTATPNMSSIQPVVPRLRRIQPTRPPPR